MPMFWSAFFSDTEKLPEDAAKAYLFLLGHMWEQGGSLEDDDGALARMARLTPRKWASVKCHVLPMLIRDGDGRWTQKRLGREMDFVRSRAKVFREKASLRDRETYPKNPNGIKERPPDLAPLSTPIPKPKQDCSANAVFRPEPVDLLGDVVLPKGKTTQQAKRDLERLGEQWNKLAAKHKLPAIDFIHAGSQRERSANARLRELRDDYSLSIDDFLLKIDRSPFLRGERGFRASFDWICNASNFTKIMEGNYEAQKAKPNGHFAERPNHAR